MVQGTDGKADSRIVTDWVETGGVVAERLSSLRREGSVQIVEFHNAVETRCEVSLWQVNEHRDNETVRNDISDPTGCDGSAERGITSAESDDT